MTHGATDTLYTAQEDDLRQQGLFDRIRKETSRIGIPNIQGHITEVPGGWFLDQVKVSIHHPSVSDPVRLTVVWDEEKGDLVYRNARGQVVELSGNAYEHQEGSLESKVVNDVFSRYKRNYLELDVVDEFGKEEAVGDISREAWRATAKTLVAAFMMSLATVVFVLLGRVTDWVSVDVAVFVASLSASMVLIALAAFPPAIIISAVWSARFCDERVRWGNMEEWNRDLALTFYDLFESTEERRIFVQTLMSRAAEAGIENVQGLRAWEVRTPPSSKWASQDPVVALTGDVKRDGKSTNEVIMFDGRNFLLPGDSVIL